MISRRQWLISAAKWGPLAGAGLVWPHSLWESLVLGDDAPRLAPAFAQDLIRNAPKARYWISAATPGVDCLKCHHPGDKLADRNHHQSEKEPAVKCLLCAQTCTIAAGDRGKCRARMNVKGELRSLVYGRPMAMHVDPIEKKPLYHFLPGAEAFSMSTSGCPLRCKFCQNWQISQARPEDYSTAMIAPAEITSAAVSGMTPVIAFTYNGLTDPC